MVSEEDRLSLCLGLKCPVAHPWYLYLAFETLPFRTSQNHDDYQKDKKKE